MPAMVDVCDKTNTVRSAHARSTIILPAILDDIFRSSSDQNDNDGTIDLLNKKKGPILSTAILVGIMAAKKTSELIPLCHPIPLEDCKITIRYVENARLQVDCITRTTSKTGVEMEALVGASNAALCVYDMCKGLSHDIIIADTKLMSKSGGKRDFERQL